MQAKLGVMDTNAMAIVIILHSYNQVEEGKEFVFSYVGHFNAQSRIVLHRNETEEITLRFEGKYDVEKEYEVVVLPDHLDTLELYSYLELLSTGDTLNAVDIDFSQIDEDVSYTLLLDSSK